MLVLMMYPTYLLTRDSKVFVSKKGIKNTVSPNLLDFR